VEITEKISLGINTTETAVSGCSTLTPIRFYVLQYMWSSRQVL